MQSTAKPKATDDPHDFVLVPSDQVQVAPPDAEITDLLRAAARQRSEPGNSAASNPSGSAPVPAVDTTFRATAVNDEVVPPTGSSFGWRAMRVIAALLLAIGIGVGWQLFGYAAKEAVGQWLPQLALTKWLPLDKLGLGGGSSRPAESAPAADENSVQAPAPSPPAQAASESAAPNTADPPPDSTQMLQKMARDLADVSQEVEALKASIAELKASQQQMMRDRAAEQNAKAKAASVPPRPAIAARRPAPVYSPTPTPLPPAPAYRPATTYPPSQAASAPPPAAQPYVPPPVPLQPQADGGLASAPRPPLPVQ